MADFIAEKKPVSRALLVGVQTPEMKPGEGTELLGELKELVENLEITVTRTVRGQAESRSFRVTAQTKVDGKLQKSVRVTVGFITDDNGDTATLVVVRPPVPVPPQKGKK